MIRVSQWEWAEDTVTEQHVIPPGGQHPGQECSYPTGWLSRHVTGRSWKVTTAVAHSGAVISSPPGPGLRHLSHSISSSTFESNLQVINFPRPRLLNTELQGADRCDRQTDGQTDTPAAVHPRKAEVLPQQREPASGKR